MNSSASQPNLRLAQSPSVFSVFSLPSDSYPWCRLPSEASSSQGHIHNIGGKPQRHLSRSTHTRVSASHASQSNNSPRKSHDYPRRTSASIAPSTIQTAGEPNANATRRFSQQVRRPSKCGVSSRSGSIYTPDPRRLPASESGRSVNRSYGQEPSQQISNSSSTLASLAGPKRSGTLRRQTPHVPTPSEIRRSYTVFRRKLLRFKRQERILLLDKQWVHILPSSTKSLNSMFDTRKSVSYHVRLLASARVKPGGGGSIVIVEFKRGSKGRLKRYNMKAEGPAIAAEIVQALWQSKIQFND